MPSGPGAESLVCNSVDKKSFGSGGFSVGQEAPAIAKASTGITLSGDAAVERPPVIEILLAITVPAEVTLRKAVGAKSRLC